MKLCKPWKAILLDLDDTLYREYSYVSAAFEEVAAYLSDRYGVEQDALMATMQELLITNGRGRIFDDVCKQYVIQENISHLVQIYRSARPKLSLYEDAEIFLKELRKMGVKSAVITDGAAGVQRAKIEGLGLEEVIDEVLVTDELGLSKPDPQVYTTVLEKLQISANEAVYVGDNPAKDFIGARALGLDTVRIIRPFGDHMREEAKQGFDADRQISLLTDLLLSEEDTI
ncbi:MAG: HAD family hydrolase [Lachnospiraceae bacterium]|nr:HAD family hydrolase [Lachnospiraceae bacterium]